MKKVANHLPSGLPGLVKRMRERKRQTERERETILVVFTSAFRRKEKVTTRGGWLGEGKKWKIVASQRYSRYHPLSYLTATTISIAQQSPSPLQSLSLFLSLESSTAVFGNSSGGSCRKKMKESTPDEKKHCGFLARSEEEVAEVGSEWDEGGRRRRRAQRGASRGRRRTS